MGSLARGMVVTRCIIDTGTEDIKNVVSLKGKAAAREADHPHRQTVLGLCGVCPGGCPVRVELRDGRIERVLPRRDHPEGMVCRRGGRAAEIVYAPDRLLHPQQRVGPRGEGRFQRVSWDAAYEQLVSGLRSIAQRHGPEAVCIYTGRGNFELGLNESFAPSGTVETSASAVLFPFGSPNTTGVGSLCYVAYGMIATRASFGDYIRNINFDLEQADLIVVWGTNPATDSPPTRMRRLRRAKQRGARVVVIDHRRTETVRAALAEWIGIRPGTDGALALGLINVILDEGLHDREFVERWTHGFEELARYARRFDPETVERITWVPAETVRRLAREIARTPRCATLMYTGLEYSGCGVQTLRAVWSLVALSGHLDTPGGNQFRMRGVRPGRILTDPPSGGRAPIGAEEYPLYHATRSEAHAALLPRAILEGKPYPIRGLIVSGSSLITSWPDPELWRRALASLELLVVVDRFPTADSAYADLVLPAATLFETESYMLYGDRLQHRPRVIAPLGEARSDYLIFAELARRLGYGHLWPQTERGMIERALVGTGVTLAELERRPDGVQLPAPPMRYRKHETGELRSDGRPGFETPTGKFELTSEWLRQHGYDPLPAYTEPAEGPLAAPGLAREFPLVFNSGARTHHDFRSQLHNIPTLAAKLPAPLVHLNPRDAEARGIRDGDPVEVVSPRGSVRFVAHVTDEIIAGAIDANMGGGGPLGPEAWRRANVNALTDMDNRDPLSGFPTYKALLCDVRLVKEE